MRIDTIHTHDLLLCFISYIIKHKRKCFIMNKNKINNIIKKNNGIITASKVAEENIDSWYLTDMVRKGELERVTRGVYFDPSYDNYDDLYFFQLQNKVCIYSYQTALYLHGLTERLPFINEVTVYQGYNTWRIKDKVIPHQVKKEWYKVGITEVKTEIGNEVISYDMERTLCDIVRDRKNQDPEIFSKAWNFYLKKEKKDIWKLRKYANIFGISKQIEEILEVILYE